MNNKVVYYFNLASNDRIFSYKYSYYLSERTLESMSKINYEISYWLYWINLIYSWIMFLSGESNLSWSKICNFLDYSKLYRKYKYIFSFSLVTNYTLIVGLICLFLFEIKKSTSSSSFLPTTSNIGPNK